MRSFRIKVNDNTYEVEVQDVDNKGARVKVDGKEYSVELEEIKKEISTQPTPSSIAPTKEVIPERVEKKAAVEFIGAGSVCAPISGVVTEIMVSVGDKVNAGDTLIKLEAMKMENNIPATKDGVVKEIVVKKGDSVREGDVLVVLE